VLFKMSLIIFYRQNFSQKFLNKYSSIFEMEKDRTKLIKIINIDFCSAKNYINLNRKNKMNEVFFSSRSQISKINGKW